VEGPLPYLYAQRSTLGEVGSCILKERCPNS
jgi:hypothetical protein